MDGLRRDVASASRERAIWKQRDGELSSTGSFNAVVFPVYASNKLPLRNKRNCMGYLYDRCARRAL